MLPILVAHCIVAPRYAANASHNVPHLHTNFHHSNLHTNFNSTCTCRAQSLLHDTNLHINFYSSPIACTATNFLHHLYSTNIKFTAQPPAKDSRAYHMCTAEYFCLPGRMFRPLVTSLTGAAGGGLWGKGSQDVVIIGMTIVIRWGGNCSHRGRWLFPSMSPPPPHSICSHCLKTYGAL